VEAAESPSAHGKERLVVSPPDGLKDGVRVAAAPTP
jgi:hypothetical protein